MCTIWRRALLSALQEDQACMQFATTVQGKFIICTNLERLLRYFLGVSLPLSASKKRYSLIFEAVVVSIILIQFITPTKIFFSFLII